MKLKLYVTLFVFCLVTLFPFGQCLPASVSLAWDANSEEDLAGYKIYYDTKNDGEYSNVVDVGNVINHTINNLKSNTEYRFAATAYDIHKNESEYSDVLSHIVTYVVPSDNAPIVASISPDWMEYKNITTYIAPSDKKVVITWAFPEDRFNVISYRVYVYHYERGNKKEFLTETQDNAIYFQSLRSGHFYFEVYKVYDFGREVLHVRTLKNNPSACGPNECWWVYCTPAPPSNPGFGN